MKTLKRTFLSLFIVFLVTSLSAQTPSSTPKLLGKLSIGSALAGTGDMTLIRMENSLEYKVNRYFAPSISLAFAKSDRGIYITSSLIQTNANVFFSPFRNDRRNDFRIGAGITAMRVSNFYVSGQEYVTSQLVETIYAFDQNNTYGFNVILENNFQVSEHVFIGLSINYQLFENGDQIIGSGLNLGIGI